MNHPEMHALVSQLSQALLARDMLLTTAESCTGGLVAAYLTSISGSSNWFERGFVTYSPQAKQDLLGVRADLLEAVGAVSIPVAKAMALGALRNSRSHIAVSVTGIAGPEGGDETTPVGTVCFAVAAAGKIVQSQRCRFSPLFSREQIRQQACRLALTLVNDFFS